jgi:long-subunit fatty acid transport protein
MIAGAQSPDSETSLSQFPKNRYPSRMRTPSVRLFRFLLLCLLLGNVWESVFAQELVFSGVGPINHSLASAAVALPRDSAGAMQWNPATISFLEQSEFQLGLGRHNAPWYGDEYAAGTVGVAALVVAWVYLASINDEKRDDLWTWEKDRKEPGASFYAGNNVYFIFHVGTSEPDYSRPPRESNSNSSSRRSSQPSPIRVPTISYLYQKPYSRWSFGLAVSEYGAEKVGALPVGDVIGICEYRFRGYEFIPTISYKESRRFSIGFSPIFSIDETPNASLPVIAGEHGALAQDQRGRAGVGLQVGVYWKPRRRTSFGVSVRTPQLIESFTYRWVHPVTGEIGTQRLNLSQDSAFRIALGASRLLRNDKTTLAVDFRYSDYSHASALYDIPASFDSNVEKLGIARAVYTIASGIEYRPWDILAFRMGYQWNHAVSPNRAVLYNTSLPIQSGHSIHYGLTAFFSEHLDLSLSVSNAFGGGWETFDTDEGQVRFRRNPNRSNFWIAGRLRF